MDSEEEANEERSKKERARAVVIDRSRRRFRFLVHVKEREREARGPIRTGGEPAGLAPSLGLFILKDLRGKGTQAAFPTFTSSEEERK